MKVWNCVTVLGVQGLGHRDLRFRVWGTYGYGLGFEVWGLRFRISCSGFRVPGFGIWVPGFWVEGAGVEG